MDFKHLDAFPSLKPLMGSNEDITHGSSSNFPTHTIITCLLSLYLSDLILQALSHALIVLFSVSMQLFTEFSKACIKNLPLFLIIFIVYPMGGWSEDCKAELVCLPISIPECVMSLSCDYF